MRSNPLLFLVSLGILFHNTISTLSASEPIFRHAGFEQLSTGEFSNAGQNLFVSRRGDLKLINWFDLDRDGYPELVINNDHSPYENSDSLIYYQHPVEGFLSLLPTVSQEGGVFENLAWMRAAASRTKFLPSMGGGRSLIEDLNGDGWPEIIFTNFIHGSTHDHFPVFVYWGTVSGYSTNRRSEFPSESATGVAVADLNGDGRPDLVVANMGKEDDTVFASAGPRVPSAPPIVEGATAPAQIYWQSEAGFSVDRVSTLPTRHAVDVKIGDLDGDGHLDLVFLQGGDWPSVRVFPGSDQGFSAERVSETSVEGRGFLRGFAGELAIADLDGDHQPDLAVAAGAELELLLNRGQDLSTWDHSTLPADTALSVIAKDLNGDGRADLAVSGFRAENREQTNTRAFVYWNSSNGFSASQNTPLPVMGGTSVRAGDVNGDGFIDLAFTNSQDNSTFDVPSYLYWGGSNGFSAARREELMSFGAVSIAMGDLNRDHTVDLFIANRSSGRTSGGGAINSFIYWGNPDRSYNRTTLTNVPLSTGFSSSAGDIFDKGRSAIAFTERGGVAVAQMAEDRTVEEIRRWPLLPSRGFTTSLADLDRDGRLDLLVGLIDGEGRNLAILRGSVDGFSPPEYYKPGLPIIASGVADLDGDGRLDIILGGRGGWLFCPLDGKGIPLIDRAERIPSDFQIQRLTVADLNKDGQPEVIATHYREMTGRRNAINSAIYWNRDGHFSLEESTELPTFGSHWVSVADTRGSGDLDVLYSNYHGETTRTVGLFVYQPDEQGAYSASHRTVLPAYSSSANFVADLDQDGFTDIAVVNHTGPTIALGLGQKTGNHGVGSFVYWGAEDGFTTERRTTVASHGPHKILNAEPGDILRRRPYETYTSAWQEVSLSAGEYDFVLEGEFLGGASCRAEVHIKNGTPMDWSNLTQLSATSDKLHFHFRTSTPIKELRYRLHLDTGGVGTGPIVRTITLSKHD